MEDRFDAALAAGAQARPDSESAPGDLPRPAEEANAFSGPIAGPEEGSPGENPSAAGAKESPFPAVGELPSRRLTPRLAVGLVLLQSLFFGFGDPISKGAFDVAPVYALLSVRYLLALLALLLVAGRKIAAGLRRCRVRDWIGPALCIAAANVLGNVALKLTAATSVAFLRSLSTVMTPLLALALFRRKYDRKRIPIQLLVAVGLYLLCGMGGLNGFGAGEVLSLLTALLLAGALVLGQASLQSMDPATLSAVQTAVAAAMATACAFLFDGGWTPLAAATPAVWGVIAYLAIPCTVVGFLLQNAALTAVSARTVALVQSSCPVMTALFSFLLLGERLYGWGLLGAGVIVACVAAESLLPEDGLAIRREMR